MIVDRYVYEPFLQNGGTPICCRSYDEVDRLIQDMSTLFPEISDRLAKLSNILGIEDDYKFEVVYRFSYNGSGSVYANFCTYDWYRRQGYQIAEFSDILAEHSNEDEDDSAWELEDLSVLFT